MKKHFASVAAALLVAVAARPAAAQLIPNFTPFSFEVRGGAALPQGDFGDDADIGLALAGSVTFHPAPILGVYAGYSQNEFGDDWKDSGIDAGVRASIPTLILPFSPWAKAGIVYHQLENDLVEFDRELGYELGAGLAWSIFPKLTLTPGVSLTSYSVDGGALGDLDVRYLKVDIGARLRL